MKIKEQTRKLAAGCSKHCFEVMDTTDEVSHIYTALTRFEEIFEEYKNPQDTFFYPLVYKENTYEKTAISIFALLTLGVCCLFLFSQQSYKKQSFNTMLTTRTCPVG
ncbi:hypothetical protein [Streptococcus pneumoniae]|uniref:hypothetical protein n=1 Tax=Streptococcus pneumoniae TaxID=1313 RepID=UPI001C5C8BF0|nr:hypothetical protein [Streptococcus pneumoniae]